MCGVYVIFSRLPLALRTHSSCGTPAHTQRLFIICPLVFVSPLATGIVQDSGIYATFYALCLNILGRHSPDLEDW